MSLPEPYGVAAPEPQPQGASHRRLAKLGTCRQYFFGDTYQGATAVNTATTRRHVSWKNIFGSLRCQEPGNHNITEVQINKLRHDVIYWNDKKGESCQQGGRPTRLQGRVRTARLQRVQHPQRRPWQPLQTLGHALAL
jgi:hypothetical protein